MDLTEVKSLLKTYCKQNHYKSPKYKIIFINTEINDYKKLYTISVEIKGVLTVADSGISRRIAEKKAAIKALKQLKVINEDDNVADEDVMVNDNNNVIDNKSYKKEPESGAKVELINQNNNKLDPIVKVRVNEVSENTKNIVLNKTPAKTPKKQNDLKFIDENLNFQPKRTSSPVSNEPKVQNNSRNNNEELPKNENITDLDENPICGLIQYCLRTGVPLPFYDFNFSDGQFTTQCRVEAKGTEYIGFGQSSTLRVAKMVASQEVIDQLKNKNLFFNSLDDQSLVVENDYKIESTGITEYSTLTINMKTTEQKIIHNNSQDYEDLDPKNDSFNSMDDNNNKKEIRFNTIDKTFEQNYSLIIDNPIGYLQKYCAKNKIPVPKYEEESRAGQDHCPIFWYKCSLQTKDRDIIGIGGGNSKKSAKKAAAEEVVRLLHNL